jgi:iron(III) transport system substrate-binding protein
MRLAILALGLAAFVSPVSAFEVEATRDYPVSAAATELRILSTADIDVFEPIILAFQAKNPTISITYDVASSAQVMQALYTEGARYDLAISSAMDLQIKLANDGLVQPHRSNLTDAHPLWAKWHDEVFAFTREPAVLVISEAAFADLDVPENRRDLIQLMRDNPDRFRGRIGTYDTRTSGLGYLFATQDSRNTETYWQLTEVMGRLDTALYCCSGAMITDVANGELDIAYNVLGSYAEARVRNTDGIRAIELDDYVSVMLRTALIPISAENPQAGGAMIDYLLSSDAPELLQEVGLPPVIVGNEVTGTPLRPIRLGPELLVFLDQMRRETFLRNWSNSILQD